MYKKLPTGKIKKQIYTNYNEIHNKFVAFQNLVNNSKDKIDKEFFLWFKERVLELHELLEHLGQRSFFETLKELN